MSEKWLTADGELTSHAHTVLSRLQSIFVQRLAALQFAGEKEAAPLLHGLSMGPFEQKWGALTVALWLAQEARGDERNLQKWVKAGAPGVLLLAQKYLPAALRKALPGMPR